MSNLMKNTLENKFFERGSLLASTYATVHKKNFGKL